MRSLLFKFKFNMILNSAILLWKLLVFEFLLCILRHCFVQCRYSCRNYPSARCASAANVVLQGRRHIGSQERSP
jgi:hypothetical protein